MALSSDPRWIHRGERGSIIVLTAMVMLVMLMIAAFATDVGAWYRQGQEQQRSADLASLNGVQGYENERKAQFNAISTPATPVASWSDIDGPGNATLRESIDHASLEAAVNAIIDVLKSEGHPTTQVAGTNPSYQHPSGSDPYPSDASGNPIPANSSSATFVTNDGITVVVTRTSDLTISVSVTQPGTQYFSSIISASPNIERVSESKFSNCNADCSRDIELSPPFAGFQATGSGDGFRPLIGNNGRIWTVNHHGGDIVCMDSNTLAECSGWSPLDVDDADNLQTARKPHDVIDNDRNQIYYTADNDSTDEWGIACVDTVVRRHCPGEEFTPLHDFTDGGGSVSYITGSGVFRVGTYPNDRLYAMGQNGIMHCMLPSALGVSPTVECPGYPKTTSIYGRSWLPDLDDDAHTLLGEQIGTKIYFYHDAKGSSSPYGAFTCWNTVTNNECWNYTATPTYTSGRGIFFIAYDTAGNPEGFCYAKEASPSVDLTHTCARLSNGALFTSNIPNLISAIKPTRGYIYGEGLSIDGERTIFGIRGSGYGEVYCYSWATQSSCGVLTGAEEIYGMAKLSDDCIIGVGHSSRFVSINPVTMTSCTGTTVNTQIYPCPCGDGLTSRYGTLDLPQELKDVLVSAHARVTDPSGTVPDLVHPDLLTSPMELSQFDGLPGPLTLEITVNSKVDAATGDLLWTQTYFANLALTVQPTLIG